MKASESQNLTSDKQAMDFKALHLRLLQRITARIEAADHIDQALREVSQELCKFFNADRLTLYTCNQDQTTLTARFETGVHSSPGLQLPISPQSIPGYAALSRQSLNLADVHDEAALRKIHPSLTFLKQTDPQPELRPKQMLVAPIVAGGNLQGVLQVSHHKSGEPFGELEAEGLTQLCEALARGMPPLARKPEPAPPAETGKYDSLVAEGLITREQLHQCMEQARRAGESVEQLLMSRHALKPAQIGQALAKFFAVPYEPFNPRRSRHEPLHGSLKGEFVHKQGWLALEESPQGLVIMCLDPQAIRNTRAVTQMFGRQAKFAYRVTTQVEFKQTVDQLCGSTTDSASIDQLLANMTVPLDVDDSNDNTLESATADHELVKFVNKVIIDAYNQKASDIHIEPMPGKLKTGIRFRIDGSLVPYIEVPAHFRQAMVTRLKVMSDLDISERRKPQDGKIQFKKYGPLDIELRVATIPSAGGLEDVVMRVLATGEPIALENLGLSPRNRERLEHTVSKPYGLFYVCGPTGSGKTTTLHSILRMLNTPETKIWTAEDPVEITQKGLRQVQINKKAGIDFALVMRAFLRADPDIIMVGESRDRETVAMGVEASLTGHLVFSTLHTNSAPESITRLLDMGMDPFNFADALLGILAQRLAKKLCDCKQPYTPGNAEVTSFMAEYADELRHTSAWKADYSGESQKLFEHWVDLYGQDGQLVFYRAVGCGSCNQSGYKGRLGLHELLITDDRLKHLIQERARVADLFAAALESGMHTLKMDGMEKILMGWTDLKQVRSVCIK